MYLLKLSCLEAIQELDGEFVKTISDDVYDFLQISDNKIVFENLYELDDFLESLCIEYDEKDVEENNNKIIINAFKYLKKKKLFLNKNVKEELAYLNGKYRGVIIYTFVISKLEEVRIPISKIDRLLNLNI